NEQLVQSPVEQRVGGILAVTEKIQRRIETGGRDRDRAGRGDLAVGIKSRGVAIARDGNVPPLADGQRRSFQDLFSPASIGRDGKSQRAAAGTWRQKQVLRGAVSEIENALPGCPAVPVHPQGNRSW